MGEKRIFGPGKTRGYPYPVCKKEVSCIPDKDIPGQTILISPKLSHPGPVKITCILCNDYIGSHISTSSSDVGFYSR